MDASIPGQTQPSSLYYPPRPIGGFMQPATFPSSYQNNVFYALPNNLYQQHQVQASNGSSAYPLNPIFGNFAPSPLPSPVSVWPQPSSPSHTATFNSYPFVNEFAVNPSTNIVRSKRDSQSSIATFQSSSSGKRPRQEVEDPSGSWPDSKKTRSNSLTDNSSAVSGPNTEVQPGSTAKPPCLGYRTVVLCNDELREQLKSTPEQIPKNSRLFFLGGFPIVSHINQPLPSAEGRAKQEEEARQKDRTTGIPLTTEETQWLIGAYSGKTRRNPAINTPLDVLPHTSERVGRSHQNQFDLAPTPHRHQLSQVHHQQSGHRNQDLYVDAAVQNALPNQAQPASLQREPIPGDVMMHGAGGSSQPPAAASGFLDIGSQALYNGMVESRSDCSPQAMEEPASYPPSTLANQGSNFVVGANESSSTLITSPSRDDTTVLMNHDHIEGVPRPFQVFQGSDVFETLCKKTKDDDDDDESLFGVFSE